MHAPSLKILVCNYRDIYMRSKQEEYIDLQCGKDATGLDLAMRGDNTGDNISDRNRYWSEITGLYWGWKNLERSDYIGLCSYRRYFKYVQASVLTPPVDLIPRSRTGEIGDVDLNNVKKIFENYDVIVPVPYVYAYSVRRVCSMNYVDSDFDLLESIVHDISPEYDKAYKHVFYESNSMIGHNMFVMSWEWFDKYCNWVFDILFTLEKNVNPSSYSVEKVRIFGYMHEILLGVFIEHHKLRKYHTQIIWINDEVKKFKFNSILYRALATIYYKITRSIAGSTYKHTINTDMNQ